MKGKGFFKGLSKFVFMNQTCSTIAECYIFCSWSQFCFTTLLEKQQINALTSINILHSKYIIPFSKIFNHNQK